MFQHVNTGAVRAQPVRDGAYPEVLRMMTRSARKRVWSSLFLIDLDPEADGTLQVMDAMIDLATASWRGVDVRLLLGGSRNNIDIAEAVVASILVAQQLRIPVRSLGTKGMRGSHIKLVVADDFVLLGSHNWSGGAFNGHIQDSVILESANMAACCANLFLKQWMEAGGGQGT